MTRPAALQPPPAVREAAERRADARGAGDWATADELRAEIEAAGWRVTDSGTDFRLQPAYPADQEVEGEIRYGRSDAVPSLLEAIATSDATVVLTVERGDPTAYDAVSATIRDVPRGADVVVVGDGIDDAVASGIRDALDVSTSDGDVDRNGELVRTSAPLGRAAALNAGIRRARGAVVIVLDTSVRPAGDIITPLVHVLADPDVAIVGPFGLSTDDLRRFEEVVPSGEAPLDVAAVQGYCMAFRRSEYAERGPLDEAFRFYRNLDIWWSLVLRDAGEGEPPRRAVAVPNLPVVRSEPWAWAATRERDRDRLSKRNFYRVLDRFRTRADLAVPPPEG